MFGDVTQGFLIKLIMSQILQQESLFDKAQYVELFEPSSYIQSYKNRTGYFTLAVSKEISCPHNYELFSGSTALDPTSRKWIETAYPIKQLALAIENTKQEYDTYISQAVFRNKTRRAIHLDHCGLQFVDLDIYQVSGLVRLSRNDQLKAILLFIELQELPEPSLVLFSGRGYQVKWFLENPIPQQAIPRWNEAQRYLVQKLRTIGADPQARDISRVLRLDQTVNTKSGEVARVVWASGNEYSFDELFDMIVPITREDFKKRELIRKVKTGGKTGLNFQTLAWARLSDLRRLRLLRGGVVPEGRRDLHLFYEINFLLLADITNISEMWNEAQSLQAEICPNWNQRLNVLQTVYTKALQTTKGECLEFNGRKYPALYTPRNSTLIDLFQIESCEMKHLNTIIDRDEKYRRNNVRRQMLRRKEGVLSREEYVRNSISKRRPWEELGMSRASWYRRGKPSVP